jgi:hypothetical protein
MVAVERVDRTGQWRECAEALRGALVVDAWPPRAASHAPVHSMVHRWRPGRREDSIPRGVIVERAGLLQGCPSSRAVLGRTPIAAHAAGPLHDSRAAFAL